MAAGVRAAVRSVGGLCLLAGSRATSALLSVNPDVYPAAAAAARGGPFSCRRRRGRRGSVD